MKTQNQNHLRLCVRTRGDIQETRKRAYNRLGLKKDGTLQNIPDRNIESGFFNNLVTIAKEMLKQEKRIEKDLEGLLENQKVYNNWLKNIKGIGIISSGYLLSEFDINIANTVSKMTQYSGFNPGLVRGKKRVKKTEYKTEMGEIITEIKNIKSGGKDYIIQTDEMIRGDRPTKGFVLPYNKPLRTHLVGVMAGNFIKQKNDYAKDFYYPYKERLEKESNKIVNEADKKYKDDGKPWKDVSKGHRDNAAKRYMVKMFLKDFYVAWREIEGLPVRKPYNEEYLGNDRHSEYKPAC